MSAYFSRLDSTEYASLHTTLPVSMHEIYLFFLMNDSMLAITSNVQQGFPNLHLMLKILFASISQQLLL